MSLLQVKNLCVSVPSDNAMRTAVDGISFCIEKGEILGLVGESGCGKSVTALSLQGLLAEGLTATGGILFNGKDLQSLPLKERRRIYGRDISMIFQEPMTSLDPLMKVGAQVGESLAIHTDMSKSQIRERTKEVLSAVGLQNVTELMELYPHELSGGMRQRVMIAAAAVSRPKLLIADEPTTALDVKTQGQVIELLKKINRIYGTAILFISHDLHLVQSLCTKAVVMYAGRIVESAAINELLSAPRHPYTQGLLDSIPTKEKKGTRLACIAGRVPSVSEAKYPCPFAPRCSFAQSVCFTQRPEMRDLAFNHFAACHFPLEQKEKEKL